MLRFLESSDTEANYLELYRQNVYLMIPIEERRHFAFYHNHVYTSGMPIAGEITVQRLDGTRVYVFGWDTKCINEQGEEKFQSVCMDMTERHQIQKADKTRRYIEALGNVRRGVLHNVFPKERVWYPFIVPLARQWRNHSPCVTPAVNPGSWQTT